MAPQYKLTYFDCKALGEPIRYILSYGGVEYEDIRFPDEKWPQIKPTAPFGKLPMLEVDGKQVGQSTAICRYLAKKVNLTPKDDWAQLECDAMVDTLTDIRIQLVQYVYEPDEEKKKQLGETLKNETLPFYLSRFDEVIKKNGGYLVGGALTWADLYFTATFEMFQAKFGKDVAKPYPSLSALLQKVQSIPAIKTWLQKRPDQDW